MTTLTSRGVPLAESTDPADIAARVNPVAQLVHDRPGVSALTTTERNALTGVELWDGRVILNTTADRLQRWDAGTATWVQIPDAADIGSLLTSSAPAASPSVNGAVGVSVSAARADHVHPAPAWQAYTPTYGYTAGTGATLDGRWLQLGKTIHFWARIKLGTGFTIGSGPTLSLPVARRAGGPDFAIHALITDTGTSNYLGIGYLSSGAASLWIPSANGLFAAVGATTPFTWAAGDEITFSGTYEAA